MTRRLMAFKPKELWAVEIEDRLRPLLVKAMREGRDLAATMPAPPVPGTMPAPPGIGGDDEQLGLKQPLFAPSESDEGGGDAGKGVEEEEEERVASGVDLEADHSACAWHPVLGESALVGIADVIKLLDANIVPAYHDSGDQPFRRSLPRHVDLLVGNIAFNISSPLLARLVSIWGPAQCTDGGALDSALMRVDRVLFMVQEEFADRLVAKPGSKDWTRLSLCSSLFLHSRVVTKVHPSSFTPPPRVNSAVVEFSPSDFLKPFHLSMDQMRQLDALSRLLFTRKHRLARSSLSRVCNGQQLRRLGKKQLDELTRKVDPDTAVGVSFVDDRRYQKTAGPPLFAVQLVDPPAMLEGLLRWPRPEEERDAHAHPGVDVKSEGEEGVGWVEDDEWDPDEEDEWQHLDHEDEEGGDEGSAPPETANARMNRRMRRRMAEEQSLTSQYPHPRTLTRDHLRSEVERAQQSGDLRKVVDLVLASDQILGYRPKSMQPADFVRLLLLLNDHGLRVVAL